MRDLRYGIHRPDTTVTKYCSKPCSRKAEKARIRNLKVNLSNLETQQIRNQHIEIIKAKEFLSIAEACQLAGVSRMTIYRLIKQGQLHIAKMCFRTILRRVDIDRLFTIVQPAPVKEL